MKLISWNVNGLRANIKKGGFDWFLKENPDIYCVQETKAHPDQLPESVLKPQGYTSYFDHSKGRRGYSGVAVFTKKQPKKVIYGLGIENLDQEGRFIGLYFDDFVIFNIYFPNGGGGPDRLKFKLDYYDAFLKLLEKTKKTYGKIIFCGDVNTAHAPLDLARPKENEKNTGYLPVERAWLDKVVTKGYVDTFRELHPNEVKYSYWDMKTFARERNVGWRIDYFFVSRTFFKMVAKAEIYDTVFGSDHCPIALELR